MLKVSLCGMVAGAALISGMATEASAAAQDPPTTTQPGSSAAVTPAGSPKPAASAASGEVTALREVVVTARRREESLQRVPIAITALTPDALQRANVRDGYDLQFVTPGLVGVGTSARGRSSVTAEIRGQANADSFAPPGVVFYFADVPAFPEELARANYDLQSVQVLKGPQGTLFGQNTNGGAILYVPQRPTYDYGGYVLGRYGNFNDRYVEGAINIPLVQDKLALRIAGNLERQDGYTKNLSGPNEDNVDYDTARVSLRWNPTERIENTAIATWTYSNSYGPAYVMNNLFPCTGGTLAACLYTPAAIANPRAQLGASLSGAPDFRPVADAYAEQQALGIRTVDNPKPGFQKYNTYSITDTLTYRADDHLTFKNIVSYHTSRWNHKLDFDGLDLDLLTVAYQRDFDQLTEEFQAQGQFGILSYTAGAYYSSRKERPIHDPMGTPAANTPVSATGLDLTPFVVEQLQIIKTDADSEALFGQGTLNFDSWLEGLRLTGGIRYTWDQLQLGQRVFLGFFPGALSPAFARITTPVVSCSYSAAQAALSPGLIDLSTCTLSDKAKYSAPNWNITLEWQATHNTLLYLAHRHGYKTGGWNSTGNFAAGIAYRPEYISDLEGGIKSEFHVLGMPVRLNADAWYDWYKDRQVSSFIFPCPQGPPTCTPQNLIGNFGVIHLWGGEAELTVVPMRNLSFTLGAAKFDGEYVSGQLAKQGGGFQSLQGAAYTSQPGTQVNISGLYTVPLSGDLGALEFSANWSYRSSFNEALNPVVPPAILPSLQLVNANVAWRRALGRPLDVIFFVKNLTDEGSRYIEGYQDGSSLGYTARFYGPPRMFGVEASYKF